MITQMMVTIAKITGTLLGVLPDASGLIVVGFSTISGMIVDVSCDIELITVAKIVVDV